MFFFFFKNNNYFVFFKKKYKKKKKNKMEIILPLDRVTKRQNGLTLLERKPPRNPKFANVKGTGQGIHFKSEINIEP